MGVNGRIGVIIPELMDSMSSELICGISSEAGSHGYDVMIFSSIYNVMPDSKDSELIKGLYNIFRLALQTDIDGLIFSGSRFNCKELKDEFEELIKSAGIPCVVTDEMTDLFPYVFAVQDESIYRMTRHLIEQHSCRKIYFITGTEGDYVSEERKKGYLRAMSDSDLHGDDVRVFYGEFWKEKPRIIAEDIAAGRLEMPDAVVCASDTMAITVMQTLNEHGVHVPEDVAVTGYDGLWDAHMINSMLTTAGGREFQLGVMAVQKLLGIENGNIPEQYIHYSVSCGCGFRNMDMLRTGEYSVVNHLERRFRDDYAGRIYMASGLIASFGQAETPEELSRQIDGLAYTLLNVHCLDICLCEDWKFDFSSPENYRQTGYSDKMILFLSKRYGENEPDMYTFNTRSIIPALEKPHDPQIVVLSPLYYKKQVFGYQAAVFNDVQDICLDERYLHWCEAVSAGLDSLQNKLYIKHITRQFKELSVYDPATGLYNRRGMTERIPGFLKENSGERLCCIAVYCEEGRHSTAVDPYLITANAIRLSADSREMFCRVQDGIFVVIYPLSIEMTYEKRMEQIDEKMRYIQGGVSDPVLPVLITEHQDIRTSDPEELESLIEMMTESLLRRSQVHSESTVSYKTQLYQLRREIYAVPQNEWSTEYVINQISISRGYFLRLYKTEFGVSFHEDLISARMERAKWLLTHTEQKVQEIAYMCGYRSYEHFMRQFRRRCGCTALEYREKNEN